MYNNQMPSLIIIKVHCEEAKQKKVLKVANMHFFRNVLKTNIIFHVREKNSFFFLVPVVANNIKTNTGIRKLINKMKTGQSGYISGRRINLVRGFNLANLLMSPSQTQKKGKLIERDEDEVFSCFFTAPCVLNIAYKLRTQKIIKINVKCSKI